MELAIKLKIFSHIIDLAVALTLRIDPKIFPFWQV
jgi:hypothetical protein